MPEKKSKSLLHPACRNVNESAVTRLNALLCAVGQGRERLDRLPGNFFSAWGIIEVAREWRA